MISSLPTAWRQRADAPWVPAEVRAAFIGCAEELEAALRDADNALLSPAEAAEECGLAVATIRKKLGNGSLPNEGAPYRPRVRRRVLKEKLAAKVAPGIRIVR